MKSPFNSTQSHEIPIVYGEANPTAWAPLIWPFWPWLPKMAQAQRRGGGDDSHVDFHGRFHANFVFS